MHVGDTMSTVGVFSTVGGYHPLKFEYRGGYHDMWGYHEYCGGCLVSWGTQITKDFPPMVLNTPYGTHDIPTVLNIPHGTQDNPHSTHDIPTVLNTPTVLKISPTFIMIFPHGTEHPHGTQDILPRYS